MYSIPIKSLSEVATVVNCELSVSDLAWTDQDLSIEAPVKFACKIRRDGNRLHFEGTIETVLTTACARCLEAAVVVINDTFDYDLDLALTSDSPEDYDPLVQEINQEGHLKLGLIARERLYLNVPFRVLCKPDCKGLCPQCGQNRNSESCTCTSNYIDPRLASLKTWQTES